MAFVETHLECSDCGSSDARSVDDNGWSYCFACETNKPEGSETVMTTTPMTTKMTGTYVSIPDRGIQQDTCATYKCERNGEFITFGYTNTNGQVIATKKRYPNKTFNVEGDWKEAGLYGQSLFKAGGRYVTIVEGELDALAAYQMLGSKWPVVSIKNGASGALKDCKKHYEWLSSFESIVVCFDNDDPGIKATEDIAELFGKKVRVFRHKEGMKDACDYLKAGKAKDFSSCWWDAEQYSPVGFVHLSQMWEAFANEDANVKIPFPPAWSQLNDMMGGGTERGEVTVIGALTSIGKSTIIANIVHHLMDSTEFKVGALYLEGTQREVVRDILSLDLSTNLRRTDRNTMDKAQLKDHWDNSIVPRDNFVFVDHRGSLTNDDILSKLQYLAKGEECDVIIIDPLQAAVDTSDNGKVIQFMDMILKFAKETDAAVFLVSHMRKPEGNDPHAVSEYHLLGSSSINQIAYNTVLVSRDKMSTDNEKKNATLLHLPKCRRTGETGLAGWLRYDVDTTHMYPTGNPYEEELEEL